MDYAWEKLTQAVDSLIGAGPLQEGLVFAGQVLARLRPEHFRDEDARVRWSAIMERLTARQEVASVDEGSLAATAWTLSDDEAERIARQIHELYGLHQLWSVDRAERDVVVCSQCDLRRMGGPDEGDELWLIRGDGRGSLTVLCPRCYADESRSSGKVER